MKSWYKKVLLLGVLSVVFFACSTVQAAAVPSIVSYQGRLADASGNLLGGSGTTYYFKFSLWDNPTVGSGSRVWPTSSVLSVPLTVRQGVFTANIGDIAAGYPQALDYDFSTATDVYLQVEVSTDNVTFQTLSPRQRVTATPFARVAGAVSGSTTPSSFGTTTPFGTSVVSIQATSTNSVALTLRSILGQIAKILQIQDSNGNNVFAVDGAGNVDAKTLNVTSTTATSTFAGGIAVTGGCISVNGTCVVGGAGLASLNGLSGANQTFATSSDTNIGLTISSVGTTHTFSTQWLGTLAVNRGGTGLSSATANQLLMGNSTGTGYIQIATSSLGINFADIKGTITSGQITPSLVINGGTIDNTPIGATTASTGVFTNATTSNLVTTGTASSSSAIISNGLTLGTLSGFLKATAGVVSSSLVSLTNDVSGVLDVTNGGTGLASVQSGAVLLGNGSGTLATTSRGDLTETGSSILTITGGANSVLGTGTSIQVQQAGLAQAGFLSASDFGNFNGKLSSSSLSATYPLSYNGAGLFSLGFGTTTSNTWAGTQTFTNTIAGSINGNANTATTLATPRTINGVSFDGSTNITIASTTLLANNNTFSGTDTFNGNTTLTNATSSNFFSTIASSTNLYAQTASVGTLNLAGLTTLSGGYVSGASSTVVGNFTTTGNLSVTGTSLHTGLATFTNGFISNASSTNVGAFTNTGAGLFNSTLGVTGLSTLSGGFISGASSTIVGAFTATGAGSSLSVSSTGFGTTTLSGLKIAGSATSTSNVGFNITTGCFSINGTCVGGGSGDASLTAANTWTLLQTLTSGFISNSSSTVVGAFTGTGTGNFGSVNLASDAGSYSIGGQNALKISTSRFNLFAGAAAGASDSASFDNTGLGYQALSLADINADNTAVGYQSLKNIADGGFGGGLGNTAVGSLAMTDNTTGSFNSAFGYQSLASSTANNATAFGYQTMASSSNAGSAFGYQAMKYQSSGGGNSAFGNQALMDVDTGFGNSAFGSTALVLSTGNYNSAFGQYALSSNRTGGSNTAVGNEAGQYVTGSNNTALGFGSMYAGTGNSGSTAVGYQSNYFESYATNTVVIGGGAGQGTGAYHNQGTAILGYFAGFNNTTGSDFNTLLGYQSGSSITSGYGNTLVGASQNTSNLSSGGNNIGIGNNIFFQSATANNQFNLGNILFGTLPATSTSFALPTSGTIGVGTSTPFGLLSVQRNYGSTNANLLYVASSTSATGANATPFLSVSATGFGTTTLSGLNIAGSATSTSNVGLNLTTGCFSINGTCVGGGASLTAANTWTLLQTLTSGFISNASSTNVGAFNITGLSSLGGGFISNASSTNVGAFTNTGAGLFNSTLGVTGLSTLSGGYISGASSTVVGNFTTTGNLAVTGTSLHTGLGTFTNGLISNASSTFTSTLNATTLNLVNDLSILNGGTATSTQVTNGINYFNGSYITSGTALTFNGTSLGLGTSTPFAKFAIAANNGDTLTTLFQISSSTATATSTLFSIGNNGAFDVGTSSNQGFHVISNALTAGNGLALTTSVAGSGVTLSTVSGNSFDNLTVQSKATGNLILTGGSNGGAAIQLKDQLNQLLNLSATANTGPQFDWLGGLVNAVAGGFEVPDIRFNNAQIKTHSSGNVTLQRSFLINAPTEAFSSSGSTNNFRDLATFAIDSAPITSAAGFGTTTNAYTMLIGTSTPSLMLNASTANSYGLAVFANGGAVNNYSAIFQGGNVGVGTTSPFAKFAISANNGDTLTTLFQISSSTATATSSLFSISNTGVINVNPFLARGTNALMTLGGQSFIAASSTVGNMFMGIGAGANAVATSTDLSSTAFSTSFGYQALGNATSSAQNDVAVGYQALLGNANDSSGFRNTAVGSTALTANMSGNSNNAVGWGALANNTIGSWNNAFGAQAGANNSTGYSNSYFGNQAGFAQQTGINNVDIGYAAGVGNYANYSASNNTFVGFGAGYNVQTNGSNNAAFGYQAGNDLTTGTFNTILGPFVTTGAGITSGVNNILIGQGVRAGLIQTGSNQLNIGNLIFGSGLANDTTYATGSVGVGTSTPFGLLSVQRNYGATNANLLYIASSTSATGANATPFLSVSATGFGTTTLSGLAIMGSATSTSNVGLNLTTGCFAVNGTCVGGGGGAVSSVAAANGSLTITPTTGAVTAALNMGNANTWTALQTLTGGYISNASSTNVGAHTNTGILSLGSVANFTSTATSTIINIKGQNFITASSTSGLTMVGLGAGSQLLATTSATAGNTAFGYLALGVSTSSYANTAVGFLALSSVNDYAGSGNTAMGDNALALNTTGSGNNAFGANALTSNLSGINNTAVGGTALNFNTTGSKNTAVGASALYANTTGSSNVALGNSALISNISATNTVAVGFWAGAGAGNYSSQGSSLLGYEAGYNFLTGSDYSTLLGYQSGFNISTGYANIGLGASSTANITTGAGNIGIGDNTYLPLATGNRQLNIGNLIFGTLPATTTSWTLPITGSIGIGTTSPTSKFGIAANNGDTFTTLFQISSSTSVATTSLFSISNTGAITQLGGATSSLSNGMNITAGCFSISGTCIGTITKLSAVYATSSAGTTTVAFTGAANATPLFTAGASASLVLQNNTAYYSVEAWGGGGGGGSSVTTGGSNGLASCFSQGAIACATTALINAGGGTGGGAGATAGGAGGTATLGQINLAGQAGEIGSVVATGGQGGSSPLGGGGAPMQPGVASGIVGTGPGGGGSGGRSSTILVGAGGGGGAYSMNVASTSIKTAGAFVVGAGGAGGTTATTGGAGAAGGFVVTVYATSTPGTTGFDYAEMYPVSNPTIGAGDIVAVDVGMPVSMKLAKAGDIAPLAGVVSTQPGQVLGDQTETGSRPIALTGRVPIKVNLENGPIAIGDRIAPSSVPGVGKKAGPFDDSVAIAIDSFDGTTGSTTVMAFLDLERGANINAIAFGLLNSSIFFDASALAPTASSTSPIDFVGGVMNAITSRIAAITFGSASSSIATSTSATSTPVTDTFANSFLTGIFGSLTHWFADATNGIGDFFANRVVTHQLCISDDTGSSTCITKSKLDALLSGAAASTGSGAGGGSSDTSASSTSTTTSDTTPPVITLTGSDPTTVHVGDTYIDPGANVTDNVNNNLGITASVDGGAAVDIGAVTVDTSTTSTHTILYSATDQAGNVGTMSRTVIVAQP